MTTELTIPALDHGQIRVFEMAPPAPQSLLDKTPAALETFFGTSGLNSDFIDIFEVQNLGEMGLIDYLRTGYDLTADVVDDAALKGVNGVVILMMSRATGGEAVTLKVAPEIQHITTLGEPARMRAPTPIKSEASQGVVEDTPTKKTPSDAAMSGRVATIALLVLFAIVGLMIWIAG